MTDARPARPQTRAPLTGGQRWSAMLAGIVGHILFSVGWFTLGFALFGALLSALIGRAFRNLLGDVDAQNLAEIWQRAGAVVWLVILVFAVGSIVFIVFGIVASGLILKRGEVNRPWWTTVAAVLLAAVIDIPLFLLGVWIATAITDSGTGLVFLPPLLALVLIAIAGALLWWWMAWANRRRLTDEERIRESFRSQPPPAAAPPPGEVPAAAPSDPGDVGGEAPEPVEQPR